MDRKYNTTRNNSVVSHNATEAGFRTKLKRTKSRIPHGVIGKTDVFRRISRLLLMNVPMAMRTSMPLSTIKKSDRYCPVTSPRKYSSVYAQKKRLRRARTAGKVRILPSPEVPFRCSMARRRLDICSDCMIRLTQLDHHSSFHGSAGNPQSSGKGIPG